MKSIGVPLPSGPSRAFAVTSIGLAVFLAALDTSVTNTALPSIATQMRVAPADAVWVVTAYQLSMVAAMLPLAAAGGRWGHRRVFVAGTAAFLAASALCGAAGSLGTLILARTVQGLGAAAIMSVNTALVRNIYPAEELGKGLGLNALMVASGLAAGPVIASAVLTVTSWHWLFYVNVPFCFVALALAWRALPKMPGLGTGHYDWTSALLCLGAFGLLVHGIGEMAGTGKLAWVAIEMMATGVLFTLLVRRAREQPAPLFPVDLFRRRHFSLSAATTACAFAAQGAALVALPFLFHETHGRSVGELGLLIAPWPVVGAAMAPLAGRLSDRVSAALLGSIGLALLACGIAGQALLPGDSRDTVVVAVMAGCGLGFGLFLSPNQRALMSDAPPDRAGGASGVLGTTRLLGQAMGSAAVAVSMAHVGEHGPVVALWFAVLAALLGSALSGLRSRAQ